VGRAALGKASAAYVTASERATLYGLVVYSQRRINYGHFNPQKRARSSSAMRWSAATTTRARRSSRTTTSWSSEIENLEHKSRRLDVLVDDQLIAAFYDKLIPKDIVNGAGLREVVQGRLARQSEAAVPEPRRADAPRGGRRHHRPVPEDDEAVPASRWR
jgi:hypothetical protein